MNLENWKKLTIWLDSHPPPTRSQSLLLLLLLLSTLDFCLFYFISKTNLICKLLFFRFPTRRSETSTLQAGTWTRSIATLVHPSFFFFPSFSSFFTFFLIRQFSFFFQKKKLIRRLMSCLEHLNQYLLTWQSVHFFINFFVNNMVSINDKCINLNFKNSLI